jgi:(S)-citramalyl-CoA lyase
VIEPNSDKQPRVRSWLFTPGNRPKRLASAAECGADVIIADLEDAVAIDQKHLARSEVMAWLSRPLEQPILRALRINSLDTREGLADLASLLDAPAQPDFVILPKAASVGQMQMLDRLFDGNDKAARLVALIESVAGLHKCEALAACNKRMFALMIGAADMASDLGITVNWNGLALARSRVSAAAAGAGIIALDSPYFALDDETGHRREVRRSMDLGYVAKAAIHPTQIDVINRALTPTHAEIEDAKTIVALAREGVGVFKGRMVDEAMARRARRVLANAVEQD